LNILHLLKKLIYNTALCYTVVAFAFSAIGYETKGGNYLVLQLIFLLFSFLIAFDFAIWKPLKLNIAIKRTLHFLFAYLAFLLSFFVIPGKLSDLQNLLVMTMLFIVIYAGIGVLKLVLLNFLNRKKQDKDYVSVYSDVTKTKK
jgi:hypothetical protein